MLILFKDFLYTKASGVVQIGKALLEKTYMALHLPSSLKVFLIAHALENMGHGNILCKLKCFYLSNVFFLLNELYE